MRLVSRANKCGWHCQDFALQIGLKCRAGKALSHNRAKKKDLGKLVTISLSKADSQADCIAELENCR